ncbi:MAG: hypothetical protein OFPI_19120 [Osedax symbiont Rs2]|nr:MAG: hypothetical protein OFPI_19120 [Osedax symbiont Rs2]
MWLRFMQQPWTQVSSLGMLLNTFRKLISENLPLANQLS